ncbi:MAG TPA: NAD(P)-dependent oxidoreductase [Actinomycetota bacterium]
MKVLLFGASGAIGSQIATELLGRGHQVTGATRHGPAGDLSNPNLTVTTGDLTDPGAVARLAPGHDAVASAIGPIRGSSDDPQELVAAAKALIDGLRQAGVPRLVVVGGAGSLEAAPGVRVIDTPDFPPAWKPTAQAHADALEVYRTITDLDWTYISPAALIGPGERTGQFRIGGDQLLTDAEGNSRISIPDYAIAFVDELEQGDAIRRRITIAY